MKKYLLPVIYTIGIMIIGSIISSILYYLGITNDKINKIIIFIIGMVAIFIGSIKLGKFSNKKGLISGIIYFTIWFIIMIISNLLIYKVGFKINSLIYYTSILIFSVLGGIIGKNKQKEADANVN